MQLYRGLEIITAAPCEEERRMTPHHLYGVADPTDSLDAALYRKLALPVIADISSRGKLPIVVGGSGLYLKFLTHKPADLPSADPDLRTELEALPLAELNRRLEQIDPIEAARIDQSNPRYVQRALEVSLMTGRPVSEQRTPFETPSGPLRGLLLSWDSGTLEKRISRRTSHMLDHGAIEELAALSELGPAVSRAIKSLRFVVPAAVIYRDRWLVLPADGVSDRQVAVPSGDRPNETPEACRPNSTWSRRPLLSEK